jgi:hypothetical protein
MVAPAVLAALIGAAGSIGSGLLNKGSQEEQAKIDMFNSLNPGQNMQAMNTGFSIPGMQQVNNLLGR